MIYVADMAILMSNFDKFDNDQISWKLAQRQYLLCLLFLLQKSFYPRQSWIKTLDNAEKYQIKPF